MTRHQLHPEPADAIRERVRRYHARKVAAGLCRVGGCWRLGKLKDDGTRGQMCRRCAKASNARRRSN